MNLNCWVSKIDESLRSVLSIRISLLGQSIPPMIPSNSISIQFCNRQIKKHLEFETAAQNLINTKIFFSHNSSFYTQVSYCCEEVWCHLKQFYEGLITNFNNHMFFLNSLFISPYSLKDYYYLL